MLGPQHLEGGIPIANRTLAEIGELLKAGRGGELTPEELKQYRKALAAAKPKSGGASFVGARVLKRASLGKRLAKLRSAAELNLLARLQNGDARPADVQALRELCKLEQEERPGKAHKPEPIFLNPVGEEPEEEDDADRTAGNENPTRDTPISSTNQSGSSLAAVG